MRHSDGIQIQRAIVHLINPKATGGFVLSERELPLPSHGDFKEYLEGHIEKSLHDPAARAARFVRPGNGAVVFPICTGFLLGKCKFVAGSRDIATYMHSLVLKDKRISAGTLAVCTYKVDNKPDVDSFLAILKLDPSRVFQPAFVKDDKGRTYVTVQKIDDAVPSAGERLQKCAFIRHVDDGAADYDMMILDLQKRGSDEPAQFFTTDFLAAQLMADAQTLTKDFYLRATTALSEIRDEIGPAKADKVRKAIDAAVHSAQVNVEEWIDGLRISKKAKGHLRSEITATIPDPVFDTDETIADKLTRKRVLKGKYDLKISVSAAYYDKVVVKETQKDGYTELVIHATDLHEVLR